jgi:GNAT superfamily N-acetyltransferase
VAPSMRDVMDALSTAHDDLPYSLVREVNGTYGNLRVAVDEGNSYATHDSMQIRGKIFDANGNRAGKFERAIYRDRDGMMSAEHVSLELKPEYQGQGFATAFNKALEQQYLKAGIDEISLTANIDVGGFAWARKGFDWSDQSTAQEIGKRLQKIVDVSKYLDEHPDVSPEWALSKMTKPLDDISSNAVTQMRDPAARAQTEDMIARLNAETFGSTGYPTPFDVSNIGYKPGDTTWAGKSSLLGSHWEGVRPLADVAEEAAKPVEFTAEIPQAAIPEVEASGEATPSIKDIMDAADKKDESPLPASLINDINGTYGGLRTEVSEDHVFVKKNSMMIQGHIYAPDGSDVGMFQRGITRGRDGTLSVENMELEIKAAYQGQGFATEFNAHMEKLYADAGVTKITLIANIDVGGFAWARRGFDFANVQTAEQMMYRFKSAVEAAKEVIRDPSMSRARTSGIGRAAEALAKDPAGLARAEDLLTRAASEPFGSARYPTPFEYSNVGYKTGDTMWPGKDAMLGSQWEGVKPLGCLAVG